MLLSNKSLYILSISLYAIAIIATSIINKDIAGLLQLLVIPVVEITYRIATTYKIKDKKE